MPARCSSISRSGVKCFLVFLLRCIAGLRRIICNRQHHRRRDQLRVHNRDPNGADSTDQRRGTSTVDVDRKGRCRSDMNTGSPGTCDNGGSPFESQMRLWHGRMRLAFESSTSRRCLAANANTIPRNKQCCSLVVSGTRFMFQAGHGGI